MDQKTSIEKSKDAAIARPTVTFKSLTFSDGHAVELDPADIVVFVGPNNSGKSAALRELFLHVGPDVKQTGIHSVELNRSGTIADVRTFLTQETWKSGLGQHLTYNGFGYAVQDVHLETFWKNNIEPLRSIFCLKIATE